MGISEHVTAPNMAHIRSETLTKLVCSTCKKYLSHFPINFNLNGESVCGRCQPPSNAIRNHLYERAVEFSKFPCSFDTNGCINRFVPKEIPEHEKWCNHRTVECVALNDSECNWKGLRKDLYDHFEKKHMIFILPTKAFEIDFVNSHVENCLLNFGQDLYVVTRSADSKKNIYSCTVNYIGANPKCAQFYAKFTFKTVNGSKQHIEQKKIGEACEISRKEIRKILGDPVSIVVEIDILEEKESEKMEDDDDSDEYSSAINYELLKELECLVCFEYMLPPIFQCETGHSICSNCLPQVKQCPTCKSPSIKTQNFALAQIINHIHYPCKFEKCRFSTKASQIKAHEATCIHGTFKCPLKGYVDCEEEITYPEMNKHIYNKHYENLLDIDGITYPFQEYEEFEDSVILRHGKKLFQMHFAYEENSLYWYVQLIGPAEDSEKYMFEIDIQDTTGGKGRFYFKDKCGKLTAKADLEELGNHSYLCYEQISHLINSQLTFEIRVLEG